MSTVTTYDPRTFNHPDMPALYEDYAALSDRDADRYVFDQLSERRGYAVDIGCGTGSLTARLATEYEHVVGLDREPVMLDHACRHHPAANVEYVRGDVTSLANVAQRVFGRKPDLVVSLMTMHHVNPQQLPVVLADLRDRVAVGGRVVIADIALEDERVSREALIALAEQRLLADLRAGRNSYEALRLYQVSTSEPVLAHFEDDRFSRPKTFRDIYGGVFTGAEFAQLGPAIGMTWERTAESPAA
jgi:SAM-dependent methyltransferase